MEVVLDLEPLDKISRLLFHIEVNLKKLIFNSSHAEIDIIISQQKSINLFSPRRETIAREVRGFHCKSVSVNLAIRSLGSFVSQLLVRLDPTPGKLW